jgi:dCTP deaminase
MILPDREIQLALAARQIRIEPPPMPEAYSSTSVDLTLSPLVRTWKRFEQPGVEPPIISPGAKGFNFGTVVDSYADTATTPASGYILEPGEFVLAWTHERIELPVSGRLGARVEGKSSLARCGVGIHVTAPTIHAGFTGQIQLEMFNHSTLRVKLLAGMRVCQLIFEMSLGTPETGYKGVFAGQTAAGAAAPSAVPHAGGGRRHGAKRRKS